MALAANVDAMTANMGLTDTMGASDRSRNYDDEPLRLLSQ